MDRHRSYFTFQINCDTTHYLMLLLLISSVRQVQKEASVLAMSYFTYLNLHSQRYEDQIDFRLTKLKLTVIRGRYSWLESN